MKKRSHPLRAWGGDSGTAHSLRVGGLWLRRATSLAIWSHLCICLHFPALSPQVAASESLRGQSEYWSQSPGPVPSKQTPHLSQGRGITGYSALRPHREWQDGHTRF